MRLLEQVIDILWKRLENCDLCPRKCHVNRLKGKIGFCKATKDLIVFTAFIHKGEEPPISGRRGSGTIFFSGCTLKCLYCQNYKFSHTLKGKKIVPKTLAKIMQNLKDNGAHNINLVTPTHFLPHITEALLYALKEGLNIPIVYNTSGYEETSVLEKLNGIVDIYLTDMKYYESITAQKYSSSLDYPFVNKKAIIQMYQQKRNDQSSHLIMERGLIIRHLILPGHIEEAKKIISWIKRNTPSAFLSIMAQYQPYFKASKYQPLDRKITTAEYRAIKNYIEEVNIERGWLQEFNSQHRLAGVYFKPSLLNQYL